MIFEDEYFKNWSKVYIKYCDGTTYVGHKAESFDANGTPLWFRGTVKVLSKFKDLEAKYQLKSAKFGKYFNTC